jgi:hypothetical protein
MAYRYNTFTQFFELMTWELKLSLLPRRCAKSDDHIWLELAYRGRRKVKVFNEDITIEHWISRKHFDIGTNNDNRR